MEEERRSRSRPPLSLHVEYPDRGDYLADWTANVSSRGFFVLTNKQFQIGDILNTRLSIPGVSDGVDLSATVVWLGAEAEDQKPGIGLKIVEPASQQRLIQLAYKALAHHSDGPAHIVAVDDDPNTLAIYEASMASVDTGAESVVLSLAHDGLQALRIMQERPADLVIVDLMMPVMDGYELTRRLRASEQHANVPIIAVTAQDWKTAAPAARDAGVDEIIQKPFRLEELLECVALLLVNQGGANARPVGD